MVHHPFISMKKSTIGRENYDATIIPNRGAWLEYETDAEYWYIDQEHVDFINSIVTCIGFSSNQV